MVSATRKEKSTNLENKYVIIFNLAKLHNIESGEWKQSGRSRNRMGREAEESDSGEEAVSGKGTWKNAAFHVATTIATPAAYAPLPSALASLGWPLG